MRVAAAVLAWASVLGLASQAGAQQSPAPFAAIQSRGAKIVTLAKDKDLSRLPAQPTTRRPARTPTVWEDADVPTEGRGFDPAYTYSNDSPQGGTENSSPRSQTRPATGETGGAAAAISRPDPRPRSPR